MRILICGNRSFNDYPWFSAYMITKVLSEYEISEIVSGGASGVDGMAERLAVECKIPIKVFPAKWLSFGKAAGHIRNKQMLEEGKPDMVLAFWDGVSRGTQNMIEQATKARVPVKVIEI